MDCFFCKITSDLSNPVTHEDISTEYYVKIYVSEDSTTGKQTVMSCIIDRLETGDVCIADHLGNYEPGTRCCEE